jgi:hypothetical protein
MSSNEQAVYTANKQQFRQQTNINLDQKLQQSLEKAKHCRCSTAETTISTANKPQQQAFKQCSTTPTLLASI